MAGFRNNILQSLNNIATLLPPKFLQKISNQKLILPFYHAVSDEYLPHIRHLYPIRNTTEFIRDLDFLLGIYEPLDLDQFKTLIFNDKLPERPSFLLTFDDGLREFHEVIAPILLQKGVPAICFLNSAFIDNKDLFFRYKASLLIDHFKKFPSLISNEKVKSWSAAFIKHPNVTAALLSVSYQDKAQLDELATLINFDFKDFLSEHQPYLSSDQILDLKSKGFYFGAHSIDHPEYQYLSFEEQIRQTKESVAYVCHRFGLEYKVFSFPFTDYGVSNNFFKYLRINNIVDITFGTAGQKEEMFPNHIHRIPFEVGNLAAKQIHNAELLYYLLKAPFGKNTIMRK